VDYLVMPGLYDLDLNLLHRYMHNRSINNLFRPNRHLLQHDNPAEDAVLHGQLDHPVRGHFRSVRSGLLPSGRFRGEGGAVYFDSAVTDHVLRAHIRDYSVDIAGRSAPGQIPAVHHVLGRPFRAHNYRHPQHALP